jgi:putative membrane protein
MKCFKQINPVMMVLFIIFLLLGAHQALVFGQTQSGPQMAQQSHALPPITEKEFLSSIVREGLSEIQLAKLALERSTNNDVRAFAENIIKDHTEANDSVMAIAKDLGIELPRTDARHSRKYTKLKIVDSGRFDKDYIDAMVEDHNDTVSELQDRKGQAMKPEIQAWLARTGPVLEKHLLMAQELQAKLKNR